MGVAAKRKDPPADDPKGGDGLGGLGPGGAFSRKQIEAMRQQAGGKGGGGGGGGWQGGWQGGGGGTGVVREVGGVKVVVREVGGMVVGRARSKPGRVAEAGVAAVALVGHAGGNVPPAGAPPGAPPGGGGDRPACRDFLNGNCTRGAQCRFAH